MNYRKEIDNLIHHKSSISNNNNSVKNNAYPTLNINTTDNKPETQESIDLQYNFMNSFFEEITEKEFEAVTDVYNTDFEKYKSIENNIKKEILDYRKEELFDSLVSSILPYQDINVTQDFKHKQDIKLTRLEDSHDLNIFDFTKNEENIQNIKNDSSSLILYKKYYRLYRKQLNINKQRKETLKEVFRKRILPFAYKKFSQNINDKIKNIYQKISKSKKLKGEISLYSIKKMVDERDKIIYYKEKDEAHFSMFYNLDNIFEVPNIQTKRLSIDKYNLFEESSSDRL